MSPEITLLQPFLNDCGPLCQKLIILLKSWDYSFEDIRIILIKLGLPADTNNGGVDYWIAKYVIETYFEEHPEYRSIQLTKEFLQQHQFNFFSSYQILSDYCEENPDENYYLKALDPNTILILQNEGETIDILTFPKLL